VQNASVSAFGDATDNISMAGFRIINVADPLDD